MYDGLTFNNIRWRGEANIVVAMFLQKSRDILNIHRGLLKVKQIELMPESLVVLHKFNGGFISHFHEISDIRVPIQ